MTQPSSDTSAPDGGTSAIIEDAQVNSAQDETLAASKNFDEARPTALRSNSNARDLESSNAFASPYATLQYAPRQKSSSNSTRTSQASIQAHSSLWNQQRQQASSSNSGTELENEAFPALLAPFSSSVSSTSALPSTMDIVPMIQTSVKSDTSNDQLSAAEALIKQQLRADVEGLGIRVGSIGWALLEKLQDATSREWKELDTLLSSGQATLLLPSSPLRSKEVSLSQAYNHVIFSTANTDRPILLTSSLKGKERDCCSLLTLKGLRADLIDDSTEKDIQLYFKSFVPRDDMGFVLQLKNETKRQSLLKTLMPLPKFDEANTSSGFKVLAYNPSLLLPPTLSIKRESSNSISERPRNISNGSANAANRTSATFATIFGGRREKKIATVDEGKELKDLSMSSETIAPNIDGIASSAEEPVMQVTQPTRNIAIAVIDGEIRRAQALFEITKSMQNRIRTKLQKSKDKEAIPEDIIEVISSFAAIFVPPSNSAQGTSRPFTKSISTDTELSKSPGIGPLNAPFLSLPDELADSFQDFYSSIRNQIEDAKIGDPDDQLERVEEVICQEVYDRIFCPFTSLDRFHDIALSLRIAALSEMGINLRHLGLSLPDKSEKEKEHVMDGIENIVTRCGTLLFALDSRDNTAPSQKLSILVSAHKIIVEGLAVLPKIKMVDAEVSVFETKSNNQYNAQSAPEDSLPSSSGADLVLPILIYCIIRLNPPNVASNLLYIQRFHAESLVQGEASYCLVNVQAAVAFLENLEPSSLGLPSSSKLITAKDLELQSRMQDTDMIAPSDHDGSNTNTVSMPMRMRSKVAHEVGEVAGMSNRVITGVLGSSLGAFGRMMGAGTNYAMGIEAENGNTRGTGLQSKQRSIDDVRSLLTGGAASKFGSVLNKVVTIENEGKQTIPVRPRVETRTSSASSVSQPPTDYSQNSEKVQNVSSSSKTRISDRLASIPTLNRTSTPASCNEIASASSPSTLQMTDGSRSIRIAASYEQRREIDDLGDVSREAKTKYEEDVESPSTVIEHILQSPPHADIRKEPVWPAHIPTSLRSPYPTLHTPPKPDRPLHVVLASTGSVASVKMPLMVERLLGYENVCVQIVSTKASRHFYDAEYLERSKQDPNWKDNKYTVSDLAKQNANPNEEKSPRLHLWTDEDEWNQWDRIGDAILHIELRRWADIVLVAPCSANTLAKINAGICNDLLMSFLRALSPSTPTYLFPAMNTLMYMHPLTAQHLAFARDILKYKIVGPIEKRLACGDMGQGAMQEWSDIVNLVVEKYSLQNKKDKSDQDGEKVIS